MSTVHQIYNGEIADAIEAMMVPIAKHQDEDFVERIGALRTEFGLMRQYFTHGINDPRRGELFRTLKGKMLNLDYDVQVCDSLRNAPMIKPWMKRVREMDTSIDSLLEADRDYAFYAVLTSYHWRKEDTDDWVRNYTSCPTLTASHYILLSALTLSALEHFSKYKALCLARIYNEVKDETMRQHAFVGCLLSLTMDRDAIYNKKRDEVLRELLATDEAKKAVVELQMQLIKCMQADGDATKINETLIPEIMKNQPFIITRNGIVERDEADSDDEADRKIDEMERNLQKMQKMQQQGSDIFFGGFKQMKRYPFFNKVSNWFTPFDIAHPDLKEVREKLKDSKFMERVVKLGPFCDSDKYSFVLALNDVIGQFSEKVRTLMEEGELGPVGMHSNTDEVNEPAYIRRQYLQDLYRFYSINPLGKTLTSPFKDAEDFEAWLIALGFIDTAQLKEMGKYLIKKRYLHALEDVINCYPDQDEVELDFLSGELLLNEGVYGEAVDYYNSYLQEHPNHQPSLRGMAKAYYSSGDYAKASFYYDALRTLQPDRISYALNYCMAMVKDGQAAEVVNELYRLNFEKPDNHAISNTLGWALLYAEKPDRALAIYEKMPEEVVTHDLSIYLNYVYAYFVTKFRLPNLQFAKDDGVAPSCQTLLEEMRQDEAMLRIYGIGEAEITIVAHSL
ncbi:MAG: tetratricopeptide repeat protein [Prevotella sp.]|nr:tetratricopeptide repeat protein [Prevotella sp.]